MLVVQVEAEPAARAFYEEAAAAAAALLASHLICYWLLLAVSVQLLSVALWCKSEPNCLC